MFPVPKPRRQSCFIRLNMLNRKFKALLSKKMKKTKSYSSRAALFIAWEVDSNVQLLKWKVKLNKDIVFPLVGNLFSTVNSLESRHNNKLTDSLDSAFDCFSNCGGFCKAHWGEVHSWLEFNSSQFYLYWYWSTAFVQIWSTLNYCGVWKSLHKLDLSPY